VNIFVIEPIRNRSSSVGGRWVRTSAMPELPDQQPALPRTWTRAPLASESGRPAMAADRAAGESRGRPVPLGAAEDWLAEDWLAEDWLAEDWLAEYWSAESWLAEDWLAEDWLAEYW
jgi:hypothetical protein